MTNRQWVLASHPKGPADANTWRLTEAPRPKPGPGQILIKTQWLSVDPYMRGRISSSANYAKGVQIGEVMQGGGVGEVVESNHPDWKAGDIAESMDVGWQEWSVSHARSARRIPRQQGRRRRSPAAGVALVARHDGIDRLHRPARDRSAASGRHGGRIGRFRRRRTTRRPDRQARRLSRGRHCRFRRQARLVQEHRLRCDDQLQDGGDMTAAIADTMPVRRERLLRQHRRADPRRGDEESRGRCARGDLRAHRARRQF